MPTYLFRCQVCGHQDEVFTTMSQFDVLRETKEHCGISMPTVIQGGKGVFDRSSFPTGYFEHAAWDPTKFRDKYHLLDHCEEVGIRSRLLEDGDVP